MKKKCNWSHDDNPCWGEIKSVIDSFSAGDGDEYVATVFYCEGHANYATFEGEGYIEKGFHEMTAKKVKVTRWQCKCERCGFVWISRTEELPTTCAKCRSPYWNRERRKT